MSEMKEELQHLDLADTMRLVGQPMQGPQLRYPIGYYDILNFCRGHENDNPLYIDEDYASKSTYGGIIAPQSFSWCTGSGTRAANFGHIPGSQLLFGGEEFWFFGPVIRPGDMIRMERRTFDAKEVQSEFAGPTLIERGDTLRFNQRAEIISLQRETEIRYVVAEAKKRNFYANAAGEPVWSKADLAKVTAHQVAYKRRGATPLYYEDVKVGEELPSRVLGPHTIRSLTYAWCSLIYTNPGAEAGKEKATSHRAGYLPEMLEGGGDTMDAKRESAGKAHIRPELAEMIGMPARRGYHYGGSMSVWVIDFVTDWMGDDGFIKYYLIRTSYPALTGDVTWIKGKVVGKEIVDGEPLVKLELGEENQLGKKIATGKATVKLLSRG